MSNLGARSRYGTIICLLFFGGKWRSGEEYIFSSRIAEPIRVMDSRMDRGNYLEKNLIYYYAGR